MRRSDLCTQRVMHDGLTLLLTPAPLAYGSLEEGTLAQLEADLRDAVHESLAELVVVDLSTVEIGGAGLLRILLRLRNRLLPRGQKLAVCGDRNGLISAAGWDGLLTSAVDPNEAFESATHSCSTSV